MLSSSLGACAQVVYTTPQSNSGGGATSEPDESLLPSHREEGYSTWQRTTGFDSGVVYTWQGANVNIPEHLCEVKKLALLLFQLSCSSKYSNTLNQYTQFCTQALQDQNKTCFSAFFLCLHNNNIAGFLTVKVIHCQAEIDFICTHKNFYRQGVAKQLLIFFENLGFYNQKIRACCRLRFRQGEIRKSRRTYSSYVRRLFRNFDDVSTQTATRPKQIFLEVGVNNIEAVALYKSLGYSIINTRKKYYKDGEDAYVMSKQRKD